VAYFQYHKDSGDLYLKAMIAYGRRQYGAGCAWTQV